MWLQKWIWERYKELRLKIGINIEFTFEKAKEVLSYDSSQTIYKVLNELEQLKMIKAERLGKDRRAKKYRIVLDLKDIPYSYLTIPSDYRGEQGFLTSATGSMATQGMPIFPSALPSKAFEEAYNKESEQFVTIVPEKPAGTIEGYLASLIQEYKSPAPILKIVKRQKIDFDKVIRELNSYERRYLGALLEILISLKSKISNSYESSIRKKHKEIVNRLYDLTKNDKREFSIFPRKVRKVPEEYKEIAKRWRIYLNIDVVNIDEL